MFTIYDPKVGARKCFEKWRQQYGDTFGILYFREPALVVFGLDALKKVFVKDFNNFTDHFILGYPNLWPKIFRKSLFFNRGEDWRRIRRIMSPIFTSGKLKMLTHYINIPARQLGKALQKKVENHLNPDAKVVFSAFSLDVLAGTAFGLDLDLQNNSDGIFYHNAKGLVEFNSYLKLVVSIVGIFPFTGHFFEWLDIGYIRNSAINYFEQQLTEFVQQRKDNPEEFKHMDFLQLLIKAEADESEEIIGSRKLTVKETVAQGISFVQAGYETTSTILQWMCYELAKNKNVQVKMREEIEEVLGDEMEVGFEHCQKMKYIEAVINETLRMYPPIVNLSRIANTTTIIEGYKIPTGASIIIPVSNILRDPAIFDDPDCFKPERFLDEENKIPSLLNFLPFGFGPRQCIGSRLAMLQLKIALAYLLRKVCIEDTYPKHVETDDFAGILVPKELIKLVLSKL